MAKAASVEDLVLEALERALGDPVPRPLHGTKANPGIFLAKTAPAKEAAQRCLDAGWIEKRGEQRAKGKGKPVGLYGIAPPGVVYLLNHDPVLRLVQATSDGVDNLTQVAHACQRTLEQAQQQLGQLRETMAGAVARVQPPDITRLLQSLQTPQSAGNERRAGGVPVSQNAGAAELDRELELHFIKHLRGQKQQSPMRPVELPQLYRFAKTVRPDLSLGHFHDIVRRMAAARQIRLSPYTQAMYQLPEPECALILGREVMYYVAGV